MRPNMGIGGLVIKAYTALEKQVCKIYELIPKLQRTVTKIYIALSTNCTVCVCV